MNEARLSSLKSYAWLVALATLLALLVPLARATVTGGADPAHAQEAEGDDPYTLEQESETATLNAIPESATNKTGNAHTMTAHYETKDDPDTPADEGGQPIDTADDGERVVFKVIRGPAADQTEPAVGPPPAVIPAGVVATCDTGEEEGVENDGACSAAYTNAEPGTDIILVFVDKDGNLQLDDDEPADVIEKEWVAETDGGDDQRLGGINRIETAVAISGNLFPTDGTAPAVVFATAADRGDGADALAGTPFAAMLDAPLLLTWPDDLPAAAQAELERVLPDGRTVYLLGGVVAISEAVEARIEALGYNVVRIEGATRIQTSIEIADMVVGEDDDTDNRFLIARAFNFADALPAGAAAANLDDAAVLLTPENAVHPDITAFLDDQEGETTYAIGGPTVNPYVRSQNDEITTTADFAVFGFSRWETSQAVAELFFDLPTDVGIARSDLFPDSLTGGVHIAEQGGPVLLTLPSELHPAPHRYLCARANSLDMSWVYGGTVAIHDSVMADVLAAINGPEADDCPDFESEPGTFFIDGQMDDQV